MTGDDEGPVTRPPDAAWARAAQKIPVGQAIAGKYRIERMLGSGGMGTVLQAHHIALDRPVAIKVMHTELLMNQEAARRFALEARATAALKSAHAVRIIDIDRMPTGAPFIVMELLEGQDLGTMVNERGPFAVDKTIHYLLQAADAIAEAHANGIIHRDLKPANLFLTTEGIVKVLDFGLAKALRPTMQLAQSSGTSTNMLVGSPHYMAPEQILGGSVDERTDIWGLGATIYHLLAGVPPFPAPNMHVLSQHITSKAAPPIAERRDDVSPMVDGLIERCMKKAPAERFASIAAFKAALIHLRVQLQTAGLAHTAAPGSTTPDRQPFGAQAATSAAPTLAGTIPVSTRREPWRERAQQTDNAATLPLSYRPDSDTLGPVKLTVDPDEPDNEPTNVDVLDPSGLSSTRKW